MSNNKICYLAVLFFNLLPSFSLSVFFSSVFIQPRYFAIPFLLFFLRSIAINFENIVYIFLLLIAVFIPIVGNFFERQNSLLDAALIVNWIYLLLFYNATLDNKKLFHDFLNLFLWMNLVYITFQLVAYYLGYPQFTMLHSNVPFHVESGYVIEPSFFNWLPRYTGLFIESGPLTLFLCFTYLFIIQNKEHYSRKLRFLIFVAIALSQSKFLLLFLPLLLLETFFIGAFPNVYKKLASPKIFMVFFIVTGFFIFSIFNILNLSDYLIVNLVSYELRLDAIKESIEGFSNIKLFGNIFQGSNYDASSGTQELQKWDIFSILFYGYGVLFGVVVVLLILAVPLATNIQYKFTFIAVLILAFLASGSLLVPQYTFVLIYCGLLKLKSKSVVRKYNISSAFPASVALLEAKPS